MALGATSSETFNTSKHTADQNVIYKISVPFNINIKLMLFVEIICLFVIITYTKYINAINDKKAEL
jgi:hypothetical protein